MTLLVVSRWIETVEAFWYDSHLKVILLIIKNVINFKLMYTRIKSVLMAYYNEYIIIV